MDFARLSDGLISYFCFLIVLTFHEAGHAWMAYKRGDDTARLMGRISLNPLVHIDMLGTVILPLLAVMLGAAGSGLSSFIIGWGKPVPVNPANLKHRLKDHMLIALAGPAMNVIVAQLAFLLLRGSSLVLTGESLAMMIHFCQVIAVVSMFLCFFNLLPVPPLDGSYVARYIFGWSDETYFNMARFGLFIIVVLMQIDFVPQFISGLTMYSLKVMATLVGIH